MIGNRLIVSTSFLSFHKGDGAEPISSVLIRQRFHVKLPIPSPEIRLRKGVVAFKYSDFISSNIVNLLVKSVSYILAFHESGVE